MKTLKDLFEQIELAVVQAADCIQKHNVQILESYFTRVWPEGAAHEDDLTTQGGEFLPTCPPFSSWLYQGTFTPISIEMQFPLMNPLAREVAERERAQTAEAQEGHTGPQEGPVIHTVTVPLIALAPPASYYIEEVKTRLRVEVQLDDDGNEAYMLVAPERGAVEHPDQSVGSIEVTIKRAPDPDSLTELIRGYDRAVRAQIPG